MLMPEMPAPTTTTSKSTLTSIILLILGGWEGLFRSWPRDLPERTSRANETCLTQLALQPLYAPVPFSLAGEPVTNRPRQTGHTG